MMDRGGHHMMDGVHYIMDRVHHMMEGVHHIMNRIYYVMVFLVKLNPNPVNVTLVRRLAVASMFAACFALL